MTTSEYDRFTKAAEEDGYDLDDPGDATTLAAFVVGPNITRIASFLGRPRSWVREPAKRLRANGCWSAGKIVVEDPDQLDGVEIAMQVCVARGLIERA